MEHQPARIPAAHLFDELVRPAQLLAGWARCLANGGGPGGDGVSLHEFGARLDAEIARLSYDLATGHYRPGPLRCLAVPRRDGGSRPLAIPSVRDRVVQSALYLLLLPLLEPEMEPCSFGYRPGRSVQQAVAAIARFRDAGFTHVLDADIRRYFENVPHAPLLARLSRSVADQRIVELIAQWLAAAAPAGKGLAQGSPLSPLLANLYLDHLDERLRGKGIRLVRFADDFVVLCRSDGQAEHVLAEATSALAELGLELNPEKTRIIDFDKGFRFLGHLFVKSLTMKVAPEPPVPGALLPIGFETMLAAPAASAPPAQASRADEPAAAEPAAHDPFDVLPPAAPAAIPEPEHDFAPVIRPLYVYEKGRRLATRSGAFVVTEGEEEIFAAAVPRVDRIELGPDIEVGSDALRLALDHGIPVVFVSGGGAAVGHLGAEIARHGTLHLAQARAVLDPARGRGLAAALVSARIRNARALLFRLNRRRKDAAVTAVAKRIGRIERKLRAAADVNAVHAVEAEAAALYWPNWGRMLADEFPFTQRVRHPPDGPVNLALDFAAALLTRDVAAIASRQGLHPGLGCLHAARDAAGPIAYDLVEPFRAPLCEGFVAYAFNNRILARGHFHQHADGGWAMFAQGRERFIRAYEAWLNRPVRNPRRGRDGIWRGIIADDVAAFAAALLQGGEFQPYLMDY